MFSHLSIRSKLLAGFLFVALGVVASSFITINNTRHTANLFTEIVSSGVPRIQALLEIKNITSDIIAQTSVLQYITTESSGEEGTPAADKKYQILASFEQMNKWMEEYRGHIPKGDEKRTAFLDELKKSQGHILSTALSLINLSKTNAQREEVSSLSKELEASETNLRDRLNTSVEEETNALAADRVAANEATLAASRLNSIFSLGIIIAAILFALFFAYLVVRPLRELRDTALKISAGNLDERVSVRSHDEFGELGMVFNQMTKELKGFYTEMEERVKAKTQEVIAAEERERGEATELKKVLEQIGQFAAMADKERNLYILLLSSIGEGVLVIDMERKITTTNKAAEITLGFSKEELIGNRFDALIKFIHKDKKPLDPIFWENAYRDKVSQILPSDVSIVIKSGLAVPIASLVSPIIDTRTNELTGLIITFRDVREERALEEARIGFISIASHQLRTPLTSMRWFSEMLIAGDAGEINKEQKQFVERIYQGTDRMIGLVNLLLQIARVEAGRVKIEPTPVDFKNLIRGVLISLKSIMDAKSQTVEIVTEPYSFPSIPMDQDVVWQVLQNLISNASRYSPEKSVIHISIVKKGEMAEFSIKDSGIGIPRGQSRRIFEKFFRADNALKLIPEGSGLGLSLVKLLVEGWGGKIWFESEEGMGTTFYFTIPLSGMQAREGEVGMSV